MGGLRSTRAVTLTQPEPIYVVHRRDSMKARASLMERIPVTAMRVAAARHSMRVILHSTCQHSPTIITVLEWPLVRVSIRLHGQTLCRVSRYRHH